MKTFQLNKKSWHYWLAKKCGGLDYWEGYDSLDFCKYSRKVLKGLFIFVFLSLFTSIMCIAYLIGGYDFFACLLDPVCYDVPQTSYLFVALTSIIFALFAIAGGAIGIDKYREYKNEHLAEKKEPSFLTLWYRKLKDKTCFLVEFK